MSIVDCALCRSDICAKSWPSVDPRPYGLLMDQNIRDPLSGHLSEALRAGRFAVTAEVVPPVSTDAEALLKKAQPLRGLADAVNVTDGASAHAAMSPLAAAAILLRNGIESVLQLTCRDRNRIALQSDLLGAAALGI